MMTPTASASPKKRSAWSISWIVLAPLLAWLLLAKAAKVGLVAVFYLAGPPGEDSLLGTARWFLHFDWVRIGAMGLLAFLAWRFVFQRRLVWGIATFCALILAFCAAMALFKREESFLGVLTGLLGRFADQVWLYTRCVLPDVAQVALAVLLLGFLIRWLDLAARRVLVASAQVAVVLLCLLVSLDVVSELGTGQALDGSVLLFSLTHLGDIAKLVESELTVGRLLLIAASLVLPALWALRHRHLSRCDLSQPFAPKLGMVLAAAGALGVALPDISTGLLPFERYTGSLLSGFAKTLWTTEAYEAREKAVQEFNSTGAPRWHSADLTLAGTAATQRKNVVVIMLESTRAVSTTLHSPNLSTTPFLKSLADKGLLVRDMSANIPRTAGAWMAVLGGQFPLTNEGAETWAKEHNRSPRFRGLATALRAQGYATAFFTSTSLAFLNEAETVRALGFETMVGSEQLGGVNAERLNSMGFADEVLVGPMLQWASTQVKAGRPFLSAYMSNIGHFPYELPTGWKRKKFPGVTDRTHEAYLNCLLYVDQVLRTLVLGYEKLGILNDTVFVIVGDHGQFMGEHGSKQVFNSIYQEGIHVPAVIYAPGAPLAPGVIDGPRQQVDIMPTVLEILGYEIQGAKLPGTSLLKPVDPKREIFLSSSIDQTFLGARVGSRKYIYSYDRTPIEVYDLAVDPKEARPLQDVPEEELERVTGAMLEWREAKELAMFATPPSVAQGGHWVID